MLQQLPAALVTGNGKLSLSYGSAHPRSKHLNEVVVVMANVAERIETAAISSGEQQGRSRRWRLPQAAVEVLNEGIPDEAQTLVRRLEDEASSGFSAARQAFGRRSRAPRSRGTETWAGFDSDDILADYVAKNDAEPSDLDPAGFGLARTIDEWPRADFRASFAESGPFAAWESFYSSYPNTPGYLAFSRVGFNAAGDQALVHVELLCGALCGTAAYVLLENDGDDWTWVAFITDLFI